jgi:hypothetical protein
VLRTARLLESFHDPPGFASCPLRSVDGDDQFSPLTNVALVLETKGPVGHGNPTRLIFSPELDHLESKELLEFVFRDASGVHADLREGAGTGLEGQSICPSVSVVGK